MNRLSWDFLLPKYSLDRRFLDQRQTYLTSFQLCNVQNFGVLPFSSVTDLFRTIRKPSWYASLQLSLSPKLLQSKGLCSRRGHSHTRGRLCALLNSSTCSSALKLFAFYASTLSELEIELIIPAPTFFIEPWQTTFSPLIKNLSRHFLSTLLLWENFEFSAKIEVTMKRSLPRFLSFRMPKRRLATSVSAPLIFADHGKIVDEEMVSRKSWSRV